MQLMSAVNWLGLSGWYEIGCRTEIFQLANPSVKMAIGSTAAPVLHARAAARGEVDANLRKNGVQIPPSPACWSTSTPTIPPWRSIAIGAANPFFRLNRVNPRLQRSLLTKSLIHPFFRG